MRSFTDLHHARRAWVGRVPDQEGANRVGEQTQGRGGQIVQVLLLSHSEKFRQLI